MVDLYTTNNQIKLGEALEEKFKAVLKKDAFSFTIHKKNNNDEVDIYATSFNVNDKNQYHDTDYVISNVNYNELCDFLRHFIHEGDLDHFLSGDLHDINGLLSRTSFVKNRDHIDAAQNKVDKDEIEYEALVRWIDNNQGIVNDKIEELQGKFNINPKNKYVIRVFNVGQANCSCLANGNLFDPICLFDFGLAHKNKYVSATLKHASRNGYVVISHFDSDHINQHCSLGKELMNRVFYVQEPPKTKLSTNLLLLFRKMKKHHCIPKVILNGSLSPCISVDNYLKIYQGIPNSASAFSQNNNDINTRSLVSKITIPSSIKKAVLPGDAIEDEYDVHEQNVDFFINASSWM